MEWWGYVIIVVVLAGCAWMWNHFSLYARLDRGTGKNDDRSEAGKEAMRIVDEGRQARRGNPPVM